MKKTTIGGQALLEGILMRGPDKVSIVVRKPDGELEVKTDPYEGIKKKYPIFSWPILRGMASLFESLMMGTQALMYSASFMEDEDEEPMTDWQLTLSLIVSFGLALLLFFFIPTLVTSVFKHWVSSSILLNVIEGLFRLAIFFGYIIMVSKMKDIERVFRYHGAEHKTIFCYEMELPLTIENVRTCPSLHPRCGTSFLFNVMIVSMIVLSFFGWPNPIVRMLTRIVALPIIAGITYEVNRWIGRSDGWVGRIFAKPGLWIQKIATIKEPDDSMIEVAIVALEQVIPEQEGADQW